VERGLRNLIIALILGFCAFMGCRETFWQDLTHRSGPTGVGPVPVILDLVGSALLFVHDKLGTSQTACVLGMAATIFFCKAIKNFRQ